MGRTVPAADLLAALDSVPAEELADVLDSLSPAELVALGETLAESAPTTATYVDAEHPADLARRILPGWQTRDHLELLSRRIAETAIDGGRLIVNIPPQYGKSQLTSRWGPLWYLDRWPGRRVIMTSYSEALIRDRSREARDTLAATQGFHTTVRTGAATQTRWDTTGGGGMVAAGIGGTITGHGANLFVIDDPFKDWEEAHSLAARNRVWNFWRAVATTRLTPGAAVVVVMTRWHEDDLAGRLLSADHEGDPSEWEVLRIPALSEGKDEDPLGRPEGVPLIRPDVDQTVEEAAAWLARARRDLGPYLWNAIFQQRPGAAAGTIFMRPWWQLYRTADGLPPRRDSLLDVAGDTVDVTGMRLFQSWDMTFKDTSGSDFVVGQVFGRHPSRPADLFLLDQVRDRMGFSATKQAVKDLNARWPKTQTVWVEEKANGAAVIDELKRTVRAMVPVNPQESKEARAWAVQGVVEAGNAWLPAPSVAQWSRGFIDELAEFPNGTHDDQVDAFTQALNRIRRQGSGGRTASPAAQQIPGVKNRRR